MSLPADPAPPRTRAASPSGVIGIPQLTAYYLSNLIGAGIFVLPALAQEAAGSWTLLAWGLMALCSGPAAWVMGRICIDFPNANGILAFVGKTLSPRIEATLSRLIVLTMLIGTPITGLICARYAIAAFNLSPDVLYPLAAVIMWMNIGFNLMGLRNSARAQTLLVALAMSLLIALAVAAVGTAESVIPAATPFSAAGVMAAIGVCFFAFLGWENVATIAPEVRQPERTFPVALAMSVPLVSGIYLVVALGLLLATQAEGGLQGNLAVMDHLTARFGSPWLSRLTNLLTLVVVFLSANAWVLSAARLLASSVRDGHFPAFMANRNGHAGTHTMSVMALCYALVIATMYLFSGAERQIVPVISASFLLVYLITLWGAIRHYRHATPTWLAAWFALLMIGGFALSILTETLIVLGIFGLLWRRAQRT